MTKFGKWALQQIAPYTKWSDDPRTQIAAAVYDLWFPELGFLGMSWNQLSKGTTLSMGKYKVMLHAEQAALYEYWKSEHSNIPADKEREIGLVATAACCCECAKAIVASEVRHVITSKKAIEAMPTWKEEIELGHQILREAGITIELVEDVGAEVLISGEMIKI